MKKAAAAILFGLLALSGCPGMAFCVSAEEYAAGDINEDGKTDAADAADVLALCAKAGAEGFSSLSDAQRSRADYNQDGAVNASDAQEILVFAAESGAGRYQEEESFNDLLLNVIGQIPDVPQRRN